MSRREQERDALVECARLIETMVSTSRYLMERWTDAADGDRDAAMERGELHIKPIAEAVEAMMKDDDIDIVAKPEALRRYVTTLERMLRP